MEDKNAGKIVDSDCKAKSSMRQHRKGGGRRNNIPPLVIKSDNRNHYKHAFKQGRNILFKFWDIVKYEYLFFILLLKHFN